MTGAILVGGGSERMGRPKHALSLSDGRAMIEHVHDAVAAACGAVVIVGGDTEPLPELPGLERVCDLRAAAGPLAGIEALLASGIDDEYLVCPCDVPLVSAELLASLVTPGDGAATVLRIVGEARPRPLPARLAASALDDTRVLLDAGQRAVWRLMERLAAEVVEVPSAWAGRLANVNTPQEYETLLAGGA